MQTQVRTNVITLGRLQGSAEQALELADNNDVRDGDHVVVNCRSTVSLSRTFLAALTLRLYRLGAADVMLAGADGDDTLFVHELGRTWHTPHPEGRPST